MAKETIPPIQNLRFKAGDLIFKEGDYGTTIYKIAKGRANVIGQRGDREINLASLGPGRVRRDRFFKQRPRTQVVIGPRPRGHGGGELAFGQDEKTVRGTAPRPAGHVRPVLEAPVEND